VTRDRWPRLAIGAAVLVAVAVLGAVGVVLLTGENDDSSGAPGSDGCESVEAPAPRDPGSNEAPSEPLASGTSYALVFETTCGTFTVGLDNELAPNTAASLVALAREGYFDDTVFHRIVPGFVIQGGDPTQSGGGGPGYSTVDVPPSDSRYLKGVVAMAKTAVEPAGTAGSQFFVVTAEDAALPPEYAIVGQVTAGLDVVERIGALGDAGEQPTQPVVIRGVTVTES
jgi:peptidyl-prolyl cis-trans isomerase B (cyclophilin B)